MRFEHLGIFVEKPFEMSGWYVEHLGLKVRKAIENPAGIGIFLADSTDRTILELCWKPEVPALELKAMPAAQLHLAFNSDNPAADSERLQAAGATVLEQIGPFDNGEMLILLQDPWGGNIQLAKRAPGNEL